jgi:hypothetical protein
MSEVDNFDRFYKSKSSKIFGGICLGWALGAVVSILTQRIAKRSDDLMELKPPGPNDEVGVYRIYVASKINCDTEETDFLAQETKRVLNTKNI